MTATPEESQTIPPLLSWKRIVETTGSFPSARFGHAAGIVRYPRSRRRDLSGANGSTAQGDAEEVVEMIILFGSDEGICHDVYSFDLRTAQWSRLAVSIVNVHNQISDLDEDVSAHRLCSSKAATAVVGEDIYLFGGLFDGRKESVANNVMLACHSPDWFHKSDMFPSYYDSTPRSESCMSLIHWEHRQSRPLGLP